MGYAAWNGAGWRSAPSRLRLPWARWRCKISDMTDLLQRAVAEIEKLPAEEQDAIARRILAELADDQAWAAEFRGTTDQQWDRLAETVRREIRDGETQPLDRVFPPDASRK